jgi:membrane-associated phospholipid phosphatase
VNNPRTYLLLALCVLIGMAPCRAQGEDKAEQKELLESPYNFHWKRDAIIASSAVVLTGVGYFTGKQVDGYSEKSLLALDRYELPGFDRGTVGNWRPSSATASDYMLYGSMAMPLLMLADRRARHDWLGLAFMYVEVAGFTIGLSELSKGLVRRARPFAYDPEAPMDERLDPDARKSFFSGHTSTAAAMCFLTAKVFSDYSDNRTAEALVWTGAVIAPAVVGYLRVDAGKHFPSDVIAGYLIGGAIGILVPELHKKKNLPKGLTIAPFGSVNGTGIYLSYRL